LEDSGDDNVTLGDFMSHPSDRAVLYLREDPDIFPHLLKHIQGIPLTHQEWMDLAYFYSLRVPPSEIHRTQNGWRAAIEAARKIQTK